MDYIVVYDVPVEHNYIRKKILDKCLDYGLTHLQYSVVWGPLTKNAARSLALECEDIAGDIPLDIRFIAVCKRCFKSSFAIIHHGGVDSGGVSPLNANAAYLSTSHIHSGWGEDDDGSGGSAAAGISGDTEDSDSVEGYDLELINPSAAEAQHMEVTSRPNNKRSENDTGDESNRGSSRRSQSVEDILKEYNKRKGRGTQTSLKKFGKETAKEPRDNPDTEDLGIEEISFRDKGTIDERDGSHMIQKEGTEKDDNKTASEGGLSDDLLRGTYCTFDQWEPGSKKKNPAAPKFPALGDLLIKGDKEFIKRTLQFKEKYGPQFDGKSQSSEEKSDLAFAEPSKNYIKGSRDGEIASSISDLHGECTSDKAENKTKTNGPEFVSRKKKDYHGISDIDVFFV